MEIDELELRSLVPRALAVLVRRGADFATAEDAVQDALLRALHTWAGDPPRDPMAWLVTVAWRAFLDRTRSETARRIREQRVDAEPAPGATSSDDDTLQLYVLCAHPSLSAASAIALTLRAVGGLTTRQIAEAYLVPEATMAQRISRAKRTLAGERFERPGDLTTVMRVLYLVFNEGYSGDVDLAAEAIRLARQLAATTTDPEAEGLLALMLLHHARRASRTRADGSIVTLAEQDRERWDSTLAAEGIDILHRALARDRLGEYQAQAAIAALHVDAPTFAETDWVQIVEWYDELSAITDTPIVRLNRALAVGEADGAPAGLAALARVPAGTARRTAAAAHLHERNGELELAARLYVDAAREATNVPERTHQTRQAARVNQLLARRLDGAPG
ncbi:MAG: RNA polymerase subunit sigma-24 [Acidimicrobiales bacterium]|nr:RNA polymerase subunit sigma-24 [Acidimicrobiales bacterium]